MSEWSEGEATGGPAAMADGRAKIKHYEQLAGHMANTIKDACIALNTYADTPNGGDTAKIRNAISSQTANVVRDIVTPLLSVSKGGILKTSAEGIGSTVTADSILSGLTSFKNSILQLNGNGLGQLGDQIKKLDSLIARTSQTPDFREFLASRERGGIAIAGGEQ